jgi:hypothetical protein
MLLIQFSPLRQLLPNPTTLPAAHATCLDPPENGFGAFMQEARVVLPQGTGWQILSLMTPYPAMDRL